MATLKVWVQKGATEPTAERLQAIWEHGAGWGCARVLGAPAVAYDGDEIVLTGEVERYPYPEIVRFEIDSVPWGMA